MDIKSIPTLTIAFMLFWSASLENPCCMINISYTSSTKSQCRTHIKESIPVTLAKRHSPTMLLDHKAEIGYRSVDRVVLFGCHWWVAAGQDSSWGRTCLLPTTTQGQIAGAGGRPRGTGYAHLLGWELGKETATHHARLAARYFDRLMRGEE